MSANSRVVELHGKSRLYAQISDDVNSSGATTKQEVLPGRAQILLSGGVGCA